MEKSKEKIQYVKDVDMEYSWQTMETDTHVVVVDSHNGKMNK